MRLLKYDKNQLNCFSPPVMIATFIIELVLAVWTLWRYKATAVSRLVVLLLVCLATFQLAEFMVCRNDLSSEALLWSRIGYVAITALPPMALHLLHTLAKVRNMPLIATAYLTGVAFAGFFLLVPQAMVGQACLGNYVIFQVAPGSGWLYATYYYGWIALTLVLAWKFIRQQKNHPRRRALQGLTAGMTLFLIPSTAVSLVKPETLIAMPSIMCGFAVILAILLAVMVLPGAGAKKK